MKLTEGFNLLATTPDGIKRLRELILSLAVQGKLVPQDVNDEPASELLKQIREEKDRLIAEGKIKKDKPLPAISDDEKPFELPEGWEWVRLGSFLPFQIGKTPPTKEAVYWSETGTPWVSISDMQNLGYISRTSRTISEAGHTVFSYPPLPTGTLLMSFKLTIGKIAILDVPAYHNEAIASFRPLGGMGTDFLKWTLPSAAAGGASKDVLMGATLNSESLTNLLFPLPPLAEQSRIVAKVEELMVLCDALETRGKLEAEQHARLTATLFDALATSESAHQLQENWTRLAQSFDLILDRPAAVDALEQTLLQLAVRGLLVERDPNDQPASELLKQIRTEKDRLIAEGKIKKDKPLPAINDDEKPFDLPQGWEWVSLVNLALFGPTNGNSPKPVPEETNYRCLSLSATSQGYFKSECFKYVDIDEKTAHQFYLKQGDLLIQRGNSMEYVGISAIYRGEDNQYIFPDLMMRLQISSHIELDYIQLFLISTFGRNYFMANATGTQGTMPKVNQGVVAKTPIPLPPLAEQVRIVARVEALHALCTDLRQRLTANQKIQTHLAETLVENSTND